MIQSASSVVDYIACDQANLIGRRSNLRDVEYPVCGFLMDSNSQGLVLKNASSTSAKSAECLLARPVLT